MGLSRRKFLKDVGLVGLGSLLGMYNFAKGDADAFSLKSLLGGKEEYKIPYSPDVYEEVIENLERFYKNNGCGILNCWSYYSKIYNLLTDYNEFTEKIREAEKKGEAYAYGWFHPGSPSEINEIWWEFIKENKVPYGDKIDPKKSYKYFLGDPFTFEEIREFVVKLSLKRGIKPRYSPLSSYIYFGGYKGKHFPEILNIPFDVFRKALSSSRLTRIRDYFKDLEKVENSPEKVNPFYAFLFEAYDPESKETEKIKRIDVGFDMPPKRVFYRKNGTIEDIDLLIPIFSLEAEYKKNKEQPEITFYLKYGIYPVLSTYVNAKFVLVPKR